jgi:pyruvate kinase
MPLKCASHACACMHTLDIAGNGVIDGSEMVLTMVISSTGHAANLISKYRPTGPILVVTDRPSTARSTHAWFGQHAMLVRSLEHDDHGQPVSIRHLLKNGVEYAKRKGLLADNGQVVFVTGAMEASADEHAMVSFLDLAPSRGDATAPKRYSSIFIEPLRLPYVRSVITAAIDKDLLAYSFHHTRCTKIVATLGPASWSEDMVSKLLDAGLNIARMNFAHGSHAEIGAALQRFRDVCFRKGSPAAILVDLKGPEIRTTKLRNRKSVALTKGQSIYIEALSGDVYESFEGYTDERETRIGVEYERLAQVVKPGTRIVLENGTISMEVEDIVSQSVVKCRLLHDAVLGEKKGMNIPGVVLNLPTISARDRADLAFAAKFQVDYVAVSFTQSDEDVKLVRRFLDEAGGEAVKIISKIENEAGLKNIDEIIAASDGIMIARGDLGMDIPSEKVALAQKMIITKCNIAGKPVITARQMLESMITNPLPTRAEMTDASNAVFDGSDCVLLSGETAIGKYPEEAVKIIAGIVSNAELGINKRHVYDFIRNWTPKPMSFKQTICSAAVQAAFDMEASMIVIFTNDLVAPSIIAKWRPVVPILVVTTSDVVMRQCNAHFGLVPMRVHTVTTVANMMPDIIAFARAQRLADFVVGDQQSDQIVVISGKDMNMKGYRLEMSAHILGDEKSGLVCPRGYEGKHTFTQKSTKVGMNLVCEPTFSVRKTKIVGTLGPASSSEEVMGKLLDAGLNIARFNFSHGTHESHLEILKRFRRACARKNSPAAVLLGEFAPSAVSHDDEFAHLFEMIAACLHEKMSLRVCPSMKID